MLAMARNPSGKWMDSKSLMDRERLDAWCEKGILALVLGILVFGPLALGGAGAWQLAIIQWTTAGVLVLWGVRLCCSRKPTFLWPPICWAMLVFVAYAIARYSHSEIEYVARRELIQILLCAFLFLAVLNNLHRQEAGQIIGMTVVFLGMVIAVYACWQFASKSARVWNLPLLRPGRGSGTFLNPNTLAAFLEILAPLALSYLVMGRGSHAVKVLLAYAAAVILAGIGVTMSRGGWLTTAATLAVLCVVLVSKRDYRLQGLALAAVLAAGGIVAGTKMRMVLARLEQTFPGQKADDMRLTTWRAGEEMWEDHFWWGVGPGHFTYRFRQYRPAILQMQPDRVYSDYLNVLAEWGVAGGVLVGSVWALLWWGVFKTWKSLRGTRDGPVRKRSDKLALLTGAAAGLLAILLHSCVDYHLHVPAIAILVVTLMALVSGQLRFATERYWFRAGLTSRCLATVLLAAGCWCMVYTGWRAAHEEFLLRQADRAREFSEGRLALLKQAHEAEPKNFATTYAIGEWYRNHSFMNMGGDPDSLAEEAMKWYAMGMKLDPYDGYNWLRYGMCLDWINPNSGVAGEKPAWYYYNRADKLDPNGYYMSSNIGWHYVQTGDNAAARSWFERSVRLEWEQNDIAENYLPIVDRRLEESAAEHKP
jgi:O-antigen ligase